MGDSTDGIPGIPKVGEKTAGKWVEENPKLSMVLEKYQEKFGIQEGIHKFAETFNLVYLLRTSEEAQLYVDEEIEEDDSDW